MSGSNAAAESAYAAALSGWRLRETSGAWHSRMHKMQSGRCKARKSRTMTRGRAGARQSHVAKGAQAADPTLRTGFDLTVPY